MVSRLPELGFTSDDLKPTKQDETPTEMLTAVIIDTANHFTQMCIRLVDDTRHISSPCQVSKGMIGIQKTALKAAIKCTHSIY